MYNIKSILLFREKDKTHIEVFKNFGFDKLAFWILLKSAACILMSMWKLIVLACSIRLQPIPKYSNMETH